MQKLNHSNPLFTLTIDEYIKFTKKIVEEIVFEQIDRIESKTYETEEFIDIKQVAEILKLSVATVYGLNFRKEIPYYKKGKKIYYKKNEIFDWINSGEVKPMKEILSVTNAKISNIRREKHKT